MTFLSAFSLCLLLNLTPLTLSLLYGNKKIFFNKSIVLLFSIITTIGVFTFMYAGRLVFKLFIPEIGNIFGAVSLSFIGVYYIVEYIKMKNKLSGYDTSYYFETSFKYEQLLESALHITESNKANNITLNDCFKFSIEFLINNLLIYFSAGITGININLSIFFNFIISLFVIYLGYFNFNRSIINFLNKFHNLIVGILLIILGVYETFL